MDLELTLNFLGSAWLTSPSNELEKSRSTMMTEDDEATPPSFPSGDPWFDHE